MMVDSYTYLVTWSVEDGEHVGTALEFPYLSHLDRDPDKALAGIRQLVQDVVVDLRATGEPVPEPIG